MNNRPWIKKIQEENQFISSKSWDLLGKMML